MFSANLKRNGRKWRTGAILLGSAFGFLGLLWSGLIVYVGLTARAEFAPMDVLTCQAAIATGTLFGGWRIVHTMGSRLTRLNRFQVLC